MDGDGPEINIQDYIGTVAMIVGLNSALIMNNSLTLIIDPATNANSGTYGVSVTVDGCTSDIATIDITVNDAVVASVNDL